MSSLALLYFNDKDLKVRLRNIKQDCDDDFRKETQIAPKKLMESRMEIQVQDLIGV